MFVQRQEDVKDCPGQQRYLFGSAGLRWARVPRLWRWVMNEPFRCLGCRQSHKATLASEARASVHMLGNRNHVKSTFVHCIHRFLPYATGAVVVGYSEVLIEERASHLSFLHTQCLLYQAPSRLLYQHAGRVFTLRFSPGNPEYDQYICTHFSSLPGLPATVLTRRRA